jgi:hypothetical protein
MKEPREAIQGFLRDFVRKSWRYACSACAGGIYGMPGKDSPERIRDVSIPRVFGNMLVF